MNDPNVRPFVGETDSKLAAAVFEHLACAFTPEAIAPTRREHMRQIVLTTASWRTRQPEGDLRE